MTVQVTTFQKNNNLCSERPPPLASKTPVYELDAQLGGRRPSPTNAPHSSLGAEAQGSQEWPEQGGRGPGVNVGSGGGSVDHRAQAHNPSSAGTQSHPPSSPAALGSPQPGPGAPASGMGGQHSGTHPAPGPVSGPRKAAVLCGRAWAPSHHGQLFVHGKALL